MEKLQINISNITDIILKARNGERNAINALYSFINDLCYKIICQKNYRFKSYNAHQLSHEITSKIILEKIPSIDVNKNVLGWLYRVAFNAMIDVFRRQKHEVFLDDLSYKKYNQLIGKNAVEYFQSKDNEIVKLIWSAIDNLPNEKRELLLEYYWDGKSQKKISNDKCRSTSAITSEIYATRQVLKKFILKNG